MNLASLARSIRLLALSAVAGTLLLAVAGACGDGEAFTSFVDEEGGTTPPREDAQPSGEDAADSLATLRLAHLAPELGAIDFCYQAARAGSFEGPVLEGKGADPDAGGLANLDAALPEDASSDADADADADGAATDSGARGLAYGSVTKYFTLQATGTIKVAIVRAGVMSCDAPIAEGTVTLDPGKLSTVVLFGARPDEDGGAPAIGSFIDSRETKDDRARVRFIHAANVDSALGIRVTGATTTVLAENIEPRKTSAASQTIPVDALGFATIEPVAPPAKLVVAPLAGDGGVTPEPWQSAPLDLDLRGGSLHTGFVLDHFAILWCADKSTTAELTACTLLRQ